MRLDTVLTRTRFHFCSRLHWLFMRRTGSGSISRLKVSPWLYKTAVIYQIFSEILQPVRQIMQSCTSSRPSCLFLFSVSVGFCSGFLVVPHSYFNFFRVCQTCGVRGIGHVAKLLAANAEVCLTRAEVTGREQQRKRMKHENGEGEMGRYDMRTANTLSHACSCLYVMQRKMQRKSACDTECVHFPWHTQLLSLRGCEILESRKILRLRDSIDILMSPTRTWSTKLFSMGHHE